MLDTKVHFGVLLKLHRAVAPTVPRVLDCSYNFKKGLTMFGSIIKFVAETTGQIIGEVAHQVGEIGTAISEIPDAVRKGYEDELFKANPKDTTKTPLAPTPPTDTSAE